MPADQLNIAAQLQADILRLQGYSTKRAAAFSSGLESLKKAFPNGSFPLGAVHEFITARPEDAAATSGFISGLLSSIIGKNGTVLWVSSSRKLFPPAIITLGIQPDRFVFIDVRKEKDVLWVMEEALKCGALKAVVGEVRMLGFTESRRLQLAVEQSQVTGFAIHHTLHNPNITACVSRWRITSLPSELPDALPCVGFPKWRVELLKIRNGRPGAWDIQWRNGSFATSEKHHFITIEQLQKKVG